MAWGYELITSWIYWLLLSTKYLQMQHTSKDIKHQIINVHIQWDPFQTVPIIFRLGQNPGLGFFWSPHIKQYFSKHCMKREQPNAASLVKELVTLVMGRHAGASVRSIAIFGTSTSTLTKQHRDCWSHLSELGVEHAPLSNYHYFHLFLVLSGNQALHCKSHMSIYVLYFLSFEGENHRTNLEFSSTEFPENPTMVGSSLAPWQHSGILWPGDECIRCKGGPAGLIGEYSGI